MSQPRRPQIANLDADKCLRRNHATALKGRHAVPVRFLLSPPAAASQVTQTRGSLPADDIEALSRINAVLGRSGDDALKPEDVYLIYPEVGNTNFVCDRFMFLGRKTLRNVAEGAATGFAFMNSHRTGDISTPSELPFGRTFAGRYEMGRDAEGAPAARTIVGAYMLRGQRPNGSSGPTTDDLYSGIAGGTIFDVSLGLYDGTPVCDVCGNDLRDYDPETGRDLCPHVPGTHYEMGEADVATQIAKGVPEGVASYTLDDAHAAEFSAVFDGAVPGAGFRKAVSLARSGKLKGGALAEARLAYKSLLLPGDRRAGNLSAPRSSKDNSMHISLGSLLGKLRVSREEVAELGLGDALDDEDEANARAVVGKFTQGERLSSPPPPADLSPEIKRLSEQLAAEQKARADDNERREQEKRTERVTRIKSEASDFAAKHVASGQILPAGKDSLTTLHAFVNLSAAGLPTDGLDAVTALDRFLKDLPSHDLTSERVAADGSLPKDLRPLSNDAGNGEVTKARKIELLNGYSMGDAAIASLNGN